MTISLPSTREPSKRKPFQLFTTPLLLVNKTGAASVPCMSNLPPLSIINSEPVTASSCVPAAIVNVLPLVTWIGCVNMPSIALHVVSSVI